LIISDYKLKTKCEPKRHIHIINHMSN